MMRLRCPSIKMLSISAHKMPHSPLSYRCLTRGTGTQLVGFSLTRRGHHNKQVFLCTSCTGTKCICKGFVGFPQESDSSCSLHPQNKLIFPGGFFRLGALQTNKSDPLGMSSCWCLQAWLFKKHHGNLKAKKGI